MVADFACLGPNGRPAQQKSNWREWRSVFEKKGRPLKRPQGQSEKRLLPPKLKSQVSRACKGSWNVKMLTFRWQLGWFSVHAWKTSFYESSCSMQRRHLTPLKCLFWWHFMIPWRLYLLTWLFILKKKGTPTKKELAEESRRRKKNIKVELNEVHFELHARGVSTRHTEVLRSIERNFSEPFFPSWTTHFFARRSCSNIRS